MNEGVQGSPVSIDDAFAFCERMARSHYENFPVGSLLIPSHLRKHFYSVYAYSRTADDIADEGGLLPEERIAMLDRWEEQLEGAYDGRGEHPIFVALGETVRQLHLPIEPFRDLLAAFRIDARGEGYATMEELLRYCDQSANPVGRIILHLFGLSTAERVYRSDMICTALQLANFWQDISRDLQRNRINLPREIMERFDYSEDDLRRGLYNEQFRQMMEWLVEDARQRFLEGYRLMRSIPHRRLRWELQLVYLGGMRILEKMKRMEYNVIRKRPSLGMRDKIRMLLRMVTLPLA